MKKEITCFDRNGKEVHAGDMMRWHLLKVRIGYDERYENGWTVNGRLLGFEFTVALIRN